MKSSGRSEIEMNRKYFTFLMGLLVLIAAAAILFQRLAVPILVGLFLAYLNIPISNFLERRFRLTQGMSGLLVIASLTGLIAFGLFQLVPFLYLQLAGILDLVPEFFKLLELKWLPNFKQMAAELGFPEFVDWLNSISVTEIVRQLGNRSGMAVEQLWAATPSVLSQIINLVLIPFISLIALMKRHALSRFTISIVPRDVIDLALEFGRRLNAALSAVITGQFIIASIMGLIYMTGLGVIGLNSGVAIGAVAGVCRLVPYLDLVVGLSLSFIVILTDFSSWSQLIAMISVFVAGQTFDGMLLTPKIIGNRVGMHPLIVVIAVITFADWFGLLGILMAMPLAAICSILVAELLKIYRRSSFFRGAFDV
jgi:predicted PurR-regulated permease PerM